MPTGWRNWAHSFALRQKSQGLQTRSGVEIWEDPVSHVPVGVHDFPDVQRPMYGIGGYIGPIANEWGTIMFGSLASDAIAREGGADLAIYSIEFRIILSTFSTLNPNGWANIGIAIYTPLNAPEPDPVLNNFGTNFAFLRPAQPSPNTPQVGRAVVLAGSNTSLQSVVAQVAQVGPPAVPAFVLAPTIAQDGHMGQATVTSNVASAPWAPSTTRTFDPPLIIPATQFIAFTPISPERWASTPTSGQNLQLQMSIFYREVSV